MGSTKKSTWIGGTVFVAVVMLALTWFLLASPTLSTASDTRAQADTVRQQNVALQQKVDQLKQQFTHLADYKKQLAELQTGIPTAADQSAYLRQLDTLATNAKVTLVSITPQAAQSVTFAAGSRATTTGGGVSTEAPAATPSPSPSPSASATDGGTATSGTGTAAPAGPQAPAGLASLPMTIEVVGPYANVLSFIDTLQHTPRLFLVSALKGEAQEEKPAAGAKPATSVGDLDVVVTGFAFVLPQEQIPATPTGKPTPAPSATATAAPVLPKPGPSKNPLVPVEGGDAPQGK